MKELFFVESGHGNIRYLADQISAVYRNTPLEVHAVLSDMDLESGITDDVSNIGIPILILKNLHLHRDFFNHTKILREYIKTNGINIIHVQTNWQLALVMVASLAMRDRPKVVYTIHAYRNNEGVIKKWIAKSLIKSALTLFADKVFANCKMVYDEFKSLGPKLSILNLGIDEKYLKHDFVFPNESLSIVFPAVFREGKRHELIINAVARYISETGDKSINVFLPGDGPLLTYYKRLTSDLGLNEIIEYPGLCSKEQLITYYDLCNILICPSKSETYCQSLVEGFCMGKYVITTPVGIATELINSGSNGAIFNNVDELVKIIKGVKKNLGQYERICHENYQHRMSFSWNTLVRSYSNQLLALYETEN